LDALRIMEIGEWSPVLLEIDKNGLSCPRAVTLGSNAKYRPPLPWRDFNLSKLVTQYDEVEEYFSTWPSATKSDEITTDGGVVVRRQVDPANASTMKEFTPPGD
jgi:hypothetical protein